jgi:hypothetical protein
LRIHRVMDHIERHLDERLTLDDLACAFRSGFGVSASTWRAAGSKNREAIGKSGEESEMTMGYAASGAAA